MYSRYKRQRILHFARMGYKPPTICRMLREEGLIANRMGTHKFLQKHRETNNIERRPGSGRPTKMTAPVKALVEQRMRDDDETTAVQLHALLLRHGHTMTLKTVLRCRAALGWTFRGSAYCQLVRQENKVKRLQWAQEHLSDGFENVIWTDKSSVQMETHRRFCCRKRGQPPKPKPRYVRTYGVRIIYIRVSCI